MPTKKKSTSTAVPHITLGNLHPRKGATKNRKRIGRGHGSGTGETAGKGVKGQKARTGHHGARIGFEGGQMPLQRRLPKRGFQNPFRREIFAVNVGALAERFPDGAIDPDALKARGLVPRSIQLVKILGHGDVAVKLHVKAHFFSASAEEKIVKAGGKVEKLASRREAAGQPESNG